MAALVLVAAGCSFNKPKGAAGVEAELGSMRSAATKLIDDMARREGLLRSIDALQADLHELRRTDFETLTRIRALNTQPDLSRSEMEAALDGMDQQRRQIRDRVVQRHFELTSQTTAEEWKKLSGFERKALMAAVQ